MRNGRFNPKLKRDYFLYGVIAMASLVLVYLEIIIRWTS